MTIPTIDQIRAARSEKDSTQYLYEKVSKSTGYRVGAKIEVVRGRKVPVGTVGTLKRWGVGQYGTWVLITVGEDDIFVSASNVDFPDYFAEYKKAHEASEAALNNYRNIMNEVVAYIGLDLSNALTSETRQMAWQDLTTRTYAINPEATEDQIRVALEYLDPRQSSWGALRWSGGASLQSRSEDGSIITVFHSTNLAD